MIDWVHSLPVVWLIVVVFAATLVVTAAIYFAVMELAVGDRGHAFTAVSPGMLPPMGLVFGLIVGFLAVGVWGDVALARTAVNQEASSLRSAVLVTGAAFPGRPQARIDALIRQHIQEAADHEWPAMGRQTATLTVVPRPLATALDVAVTLKPRSTAQATAQREIVSSLQAALDARRERIIVSRSSVNWGKWTAVVALAALTLLSIALVHSGNRRSAALAMGLFASAVAITVVMILSQDRPFSGQFGVKPDALVQVMPPSDH
jgi:Protein of unknown function (DUF4239)